MAECFIKLACTSGYFIDKSDLSLWSTKRGGLRKLAKVRNTNSYRIYRKGKAEYLTGEEIKIDVAHAMGVK